MPESWRAREARAGCTVNKQAPQSSKPHMESLCAPLGTREVTNTQAAEPDGVPAEHQRMTSTTMGFQTQWSGSLARPWRAVCLLPLSLSFCVPASWLVRSSCSGLLFSESGVYVAASWDQMWFWAMAGVLDSGPGSWIPAWSVSLAVTSSGHQLREEGNRSLVAPEPTHIPWAVSYLDATTALRPSLHLPETIPQHQGCPHSPLFSACLFRIY